MSNNETVKPPERDDLDELLDELTIKKYHVALLENRTTIHAVTTRYLSRLALTNPTLHVAITLNLAAPTQALTLDAALRTDPSLLDHHLFYGVPIVLKDTYCTADLPTTAGTLALSTLTSINAPTVHNLLLAGAIILAKANLHELSLHGTTTSSLGGQTLNPYASTLTPGGSSGGCAAALAANLCLVACGGDTMNSLRSPASACSVVGFRPTTGQVSRIGIVPVSCTQDAIGPMARTVNDARRLFNVMRGPDAHEAVTLDARRYEPFTPPTRRLRVGVLENYFPPPSAQGEGSAVRSIVLSALDKCKDMADLIPLSIADIEVAHLVSTHDVQTHEFRTCIDAFLTPGGPHGVTSTPHATLASIRDSNLFHSSAVTDVFHDTLLPGLDMQHPSYHARLALIATLQTRLEDVFASHDIDVLAFPHQRHFPVRVGETRQPGRNGILAALTARPAICIPAGFSAPTAEAKRGVPVGLEIVGQAWRDDWLLNVAEAMEKRIQGRRAPDLGWLVERSGGR